MADIRSNAEAGIYLKSLRENAGLTTRELAERIGKTQGWITGMEGGRFRVTIEVILEWAEACESPVQILIDHAEEQVPDNELEEFIEHTRRIAPYLPEGFLSAIRAMLKVAEADLEEKQGSKTA